MFEEPLTDALADEVEVGADVAASPIVAEFDGALKDILKGREMFGREFAVLLERAKRRDQTGAVCFEGEVHLLTVVRA